MFASSSSSSKKTVLIAEDDALLLDAYRQAFKDKPYSVIFVSDGQQAWDTIQSFQVDLLVTDNTMPGLTGTDLVQKIEASPKVAMMPIIFVTGDSIGSDVKHDAYFQKPPRLGELYTKIESLLKLPKLADELAAQREKAMPVRRKRKKKKRQNWVTDTPALPATLKKELS